VEKNACYNTLHLEFQRVGTQGIFAIIEEEAFELTKAQSELEKHTK
jgi:hypothetical protein